MYTHVSKCKNAILKGEKKAISVVSTWRELPCCASQITLEVCHWSYMPLKWRPTEITWQTMSLQELGRTETYKFWGDDVRLASWGSKLQKPPAETVITSPNSPHLSNPLPTPNWKRSFRLWTDTIPESPFRLNWHLVILKQ
jgi:hypothetical protein